MSSSFSGFPQQTLSFLDQLNKNNNREWFSQHKSDYETHVKTPALALCAALSEQLESLTGTPHTSKLFRVHRDVRFSKDKTPYNAHVHISFTPQVEQTSPPMWFFGLGLKQLSLGCGVFAFEKAGLDRFRTRIASDEGVAIASALEDLSDKGVRVNEPELKRVPAGFEKDHPRETLLRHKGLSAWIDHEDRSWVCDGAMVKKCTNEFKKLMPVYTFLLQT